MDVSENAKKIISQAHQWTFEGDCSLLQLMQNISQNLEQRVQNTSKALQQLSSNVKRTNIALDNTANSLTALQYTQFVESRCLEDDETIANVAEVPTNIANDNDASKTSQEVLQTFLKNNLQMLHNCHEKYALDFEDSDDEDAASNFIYQPKNPYNNRLLPHIYGSKLWKENWHVGLCDGLNDYSGDENSEAFSESASSSAEDNVSYESNPANLSESASSTSVLNETITNIAVQNASSLRGSQPLFPDEEGKEESRQHHYTAAASSDTASISTTTSGTSVQPITNQHRKHDLFAEIQIVPPSFTSVSSVASPQKQQQQQPRDYISKATAGHPEVPSEKYTTQHSDIFAEKQQEQKQPDFTPIKPATSQIKRKPVNLFDDDEFNSFLTEIVDKTQTKAATPTSPTKSIAVMETKTIKSRTKMIDLFDDSTADNSAAVMVEEQQTASIAIEKPKEIQRKTQPLNLFDSPTGSPTNEPPLFVENPKPLINETVGKTRITAKSLFDDEDDDDDFLNVFGTKKINASKPIQKTLIFNEIDNDFNINVSSEGTTTTETSKLEPSTMKMKENKQIAGESKNNDLFGVENKTAIQKIETKPNKAINLFSDEDENDDLFNKLKQTPIKNTLSSAQQELNAENSNLEQNKPNKEDLSAADKSSEVQNGKSKNTKADLFGDINDDEDLFSQTEKINAESIEKEIVIETAKVEPKNNSKISTIETTEKPTKETQEEHDDKVTFEVENNATESSEPLVVASTTALSELIKESLQEEKFLEKPPESTAAETIGTTKETVTGAAHNFAGIFLDEPPDDDDFFQNLGTNTLSSSKLTLDLEHDFYEPALPKPPITAQAETNKTDTTPTTSDYSALSLFSDIPPDDDGSNEEFGADSDANGEVKRLHSVFYDDFKETLEAVKQTNDNKMPIHALFSDEPPPDDDFDIFAQKTKSSKELFIGKTTSTEDEIDHKAKTEPSQSDIGSSEAIKVLPQKRIKNIAEKIAQSLENDTSASEIKEKEKINVAKLQMPKININVQALLPGGGAGSKTSFKKSPIQSEVSHEEQIASDDRITKLPSTAIKTVQPESQNENILTNVCKNRVRAPAKRKPSTRRGRQESYQKTLRAEEADVEKSHAVKKEKLSKLESGDRKENNVITIKSKTEDLHKKLEPKVNNNESKATKSTKPDLRAGGDADFLTAKVQTDLEKPKNITNSSNTFVPINEMPPEDAYFEQQNVESKRKSTTTTTKTSSFADFDDDEMEDDLFASAIGGTKANAVKASVASERTTMPTKTSPNATIPGANLSNSPPKDLFFENSEIIQKKDCATKSTDVKVTPKKPTMKLFGDSDEDDDLFATAMIRNVTKSSDNSSVKSSSAIPTTISPPDVADGQKELVAAVKEEKITVSESTKPDIKLFADSDDKNDVGIKNTKGAIAKTAKPKEKEKKESLAKTSAQPVVSPQVAPTKLQETLTTGKSSALFFDEQSDSDDDLFSKKSTIKQSKNTAVATKTTQVLGSGKSTTKSSALFGSDNENDEDIFANSSQKSEKIKVANTTTKQQAATVKEVKSLFSDVESDEDDDLFGSKTTTKTTKTKKATTTTSAAPKTQANPLTATQTKKFPAIPVATTVTKLTDNPLADLLDP